MLPSILGSFTAPCCLNCRQALFRQDSHPLCLDCQEQWPASGQSFRGHLMALGLYVGSLRQLILRAKEEGMSPPGIFLAHRLSQVAAPFEAKNAAFVPIPARLSRRCRGWSLPHFLAKSLSFSSQGIYRPVLGRGIKWKPQAMKTSAQRRSGMKRQFYMRRAIGGHAPQAAWLVDDVCTTGATLAEARRVLEMDGWHCKGAWVLARVDPSQSFLEW